MAPGNCCLRFGLYTIRYEYLLVLAANVIARNNLNQTKSRIMGFVMLDLGVGAAAFSVFRTVNVPVRTNHRTIMIMVTYTQRQLFDGWTAVKPTPFALVLIFWLAKLVFCCCCCRCRYRHFHSQGSMHLHRNRDCMRLVDLNLLLDQ